MVYSFCPLSWFIPRLIPPMTRLMWHTSLITHDLTCIPQHPHSPIQSFFGLENTAHSVGIPVAPIMIIMHPLQVMIAMTDTLTLVFSAWSWLKCFQNILNLSSLVTVSKFEKFSSVVLRKFVSSNQATACQLNTMLWEISRLKFPQSHPKFTLRSSIVVDITGILCNLLRILIFIGDLCSGFSLLSFQGSMGTIFSFL